MPESLSREKGNVAEPVYSILTEDGAPQRETTIVVVQRDIRIKDYFRFIDSIVAQYAHAVNYKLSEYILVRANQWIIDSLVNTDYYKQMQRGVFIYDQRKMVVLHKGDTIKIPDALTAAEIQDRLKHTVIDVNIPEFKLRIIERDSVKYTFPVRVGRNESKYLRTAKRTVSLQTPIGEGEIVRVERNPIFVNPVTGERYTTTKRDDDNYTLMPQIPWLEPTIGGRKLGSLIHPTTNPKTLGKAYSNGCVGTAEGDAWIIYYHAPVGTKVNFRYDLEVVNEQGETIRLKDIYQLKKNKQHPGTTLLINSENQIFNLPMEVTLH
ncbi:MAG TPA: L,D-transpeptidase [Chitinophagales bacterium]|nr:L,D-transpeptidase [Chitinophagales bacterium]